MCVGSHDYIQKYSEVKKYFNKMSSQDKELKVFEGAYHDLHLDEDANEVREYMHEWIKKRTGQVRWKRPKSLDVDNLGRKYFWKYIIYVIGILIVVIKFSKTLKKLSIPLLTLLKSFLLPKSHPWYFYFSYWLSKHQTRILQIIRIV